MVYDPAAQVALLIEVLAVPPLSAIALDVHP